jgi:hypothetical protein
MRSRDERQRALEILTTCLVALGSRSPKQFKSSVEIMLQNTRNADHIHSAELALRIRIAGLGGRGPQSLPGSFLIANRQKRELANQSRDRILKAAKPVSHSRRCKSKS